MRIALDAMGGDHAPESTVAGALAAAEHGFEIVLVGDEGIILEQIADAKVGGLPPTCTVHHATEVVEMEDSPGAVLRRKRDSSLRVAFELVSKGQADAVVTMGNSGAALAAGMFVAGRLPGVLRPAITALVPSQKAPVVVLDVGANVECKPEHLQQFALMGRALAQVGLRRESPSVALLANGTEDEKGTDLTRAAALLLQETQGLTYSGLVEPKGVFEGNVDVVVTDGFTGNVFLKTAEATSQQMTALVREAADSGILARAGGLLLRPALRRTLARLDAAEVGGALLLGIDAVAVIGHGSADARSVGNALRTAARLQGEGLLERVAAALATQEPGHAVDRSSR
ncbi:MAG: phosphate acyltransferase PlsX [Deltaproteobacteria bacterium]|nr:phosphate acyltransferase PlsX [Deltaproteobacteria bacterium]